MNEIIRSAINYTVNATFSYGLEAAFRSLNPNKVENAVLGLGFIGAGFALIKSSGVLKPLQSWIWNTPNPYSQESWSKTTMRWSAAAVGAVGISLGIFHLLKEYIISESYPLPPEYPLDDYPLDDQIPKPLASSSITPQQRCERSVARFRSCRAANQLWEEVEKDGPFTVKCVSNASGHFNAKVEHSSRTIYIPESDESIGHSLAFELENLKNVNLLNKISENGCSFLSADVFAKKIEMVENDSWHKSNEIRRTCPPLFWKEERSGTEILEEFLRILNINPKDSCRLRNDELLEIAEDILHTDEYRLEWYLHCSNWNGLLQWMSRNEDKWKSRETSQNPATVEFMNRIKWVNCIS